MAYNPQNANGQATMANSAPVVIASNQSAVSVDTELTAPAALADATANPTISNLAALLMGFNGTTWDRLRATTTRGLQVQTENPAAAAAADTTANPTVSNIGSMLMGYNGTTWDRLRATTTRGLQVQTENPAAAAAADALANPTISQVGADTMLFNNGSWDRSRNNYGVQVQASTAKTATFQTAGQVNFNARGVMVALVLTAVTGTTPTMTVAIEYQESGGSTWIPLLTSASLTATGTTNLVVYPGVVEVANTKVALPLPRTWRCNCTIGGTTPSFTFSIGATYIL